MYKKVLGIVVLAGITTSVAMAEMNRPMFSVENRLLEQTRLELGVQGNYQNYDEDLENHVADKTEKWGTLFARYGLFDNLSAYASAPYGAVDIKNGEDNSGMGDVRLGLQFLAYEDIFHYPFIIPHAEARFSSGDEKKGLGDGDNSLTAGVSLGSVMYDQITIIVDGKYKFIQDIKENYTFSGSVVWDLNEQFALLIEGYIASEKRDDWGTENSKRHPIYGQAGFAYKINEDLEFAAYGGGGKDGAPSVNANAKVAYTF